MPMETIYLVAGATGGLGQQIVSRLLRQGKHVRALVRDVVKSRALLGENLEHVRGDTRQIDTLHDAVTGVKIVICATGSHNSEGPNSPEHVDFEGVRNLVNAAKSTGVERFILISTLAATRPTHALNQFGHVLDWKKKGEDVLRESGLNYTIIRPGGLTDDAGGQCQIRIAQGDTITGRICRSDVADVVIHAIDNPHAQNATFEVVGIDGKPPTDWDSFFDELKPDHEMHANA